MTLPELTLGLDRARAFDYTGLVALQHHPGTPNDARPTYTARMVERWRNRPYTMLPGLVRRAEERLRQMAANAYFEEYGTAIHPWRDVLVTLVVDGGGVGAPVIDALVDAGLDPVCVILTGGFQVNRRDGGGYTVPKADVVSAVQLLTEGRRLQIPAEMPHATTLTRELENFRYDTSVSGRIRYGAGPAGHEDVLWRGDGSHDDLLLATAIAAWHAEHETGALLVPAGPDVMRHFVGWPT
jgi:hypothetical protein